MGSGPGPDLDPLGGAGHSGERTSGISQTSDVEIEVNGLLTYARELI